MAFIEKRFPNPLCINLHKKPVFSSILSCAESKFIFYTSLLWKAGKNTEVLHDLTWSRNRSAQFWSWLMRFSQTRETDRSLDEYRRVYGQFEWTDSYFHIHIYNWGSSHKWGHSILPDDRSDYIPIVILISNVIILTISYILLFNFTPAIT